MPPIRANDASKSLVSKFDLYFKKTCFHLLIAQVHFFVFFIFIFEGM